MRNTCCLLANSQSSTLVDIANLLMAQTLLYFSTLLLTTSTNGLDFTTIAVLVLEYSLGFITLSPNLLHVQH